MGDLPTPIGLQNFLISSLPASGYYLPNFITQAEEAHLLQKVSILIFDFPFLLANSC